MRRSREKDGAGFLHWRTDIFQLLIGLIFPCSSVGEFDSFFWLLFLQCIVVPE